MNSTATYHHIRNKKRTRTSSSTPKYKIFIVEDNHSSQMFLEKYLNTMPNCPHDKKPNLEIVSFDTGEECLLAMNQNPDIVILDFYLDESNTEALNGLQILKKIKSKPRAPKVIVMSGQENVMVTAELYNKGASDYISKEHYGIVRVGQSIIRLINELELEKKKRSRNILIGFIIFIIGLLSGLYF
ncbi:MAG: response regulator [Flavobacteriales bacterium]|nr:response regulator [Flavobacteriales bacterium]